MLDLEIDGVYNMAEGKIFIKDFEYLYEICNACFSHNLNHSSSDKNGTCDVICT